MKAFQSELPALHTMYQKKTKRATVDYSKADFSNYHWKYNYSDKSVSVDSLVRKIREYRFNVGEDIFQKLQETDKLNVMNHYCLGITVYAYLNKRKKVDAVIKQMRDSDNTLISVDNDILSHIVQIYGIQLRDLENLDYFFNKFLFKLQVQPDTKSLSQLIRSYATLGEMKRVKELFDLVNEKKMMNLEVAESMIYAHSVNENYDLATKGYHEILGNKFSPSVDCINTLIQNTRKSSGSLDAALSLFSHMKIHNIAPNLDTYIALATIYFENDYMHEGVKLLENLFSSKEIERNTDYYDFLMTNALKKQKDIEGVKAYDHLIRFNYFPSMKTYENIVDHLSNLNRPGETEIIANHLHQNGVFISQSLSNKFQNIQETKNLAFPIHQ